MKRTRDHSVIVTAVNLAKVPAHWLCEVCHRPKREHAKRTLRCPTTYWPVMADEPNIYD